ncbi:MAG: branched-chain amino acid ABC transporter permease, partial [Chloroflexi bacterium]|nr:branched-chain amino acid ABC transporter permease [Chloroflexota bacterium]
TLSAGLLSLGNGAFMGIGAYTSALLTKFYHWPFPAVLLAGCVVAGVSGFLLGLPVLRLRGIFLAIATIGFGEIVRIVALNWEPTGEALGLNGIPVITELWQVVVALIVVSYFLIRLRHSRTGHALLALREDEAAARTMGVNTFYYKMLTFTIGAVIAGLAGGFSAHQTHFIAPVDFGFSTAANILIYAIVGGTGAFWGPMLGAVLLTVLPESLRFLNDYRLIFNGLVLLLIIIFLPDGLITLFRYRPGKRLAAQATAPSLDAAEA